MNGEMGVCGKEEKKRIYEEEKENDCCGWDDCGRGMREIWGREGSWRYKGGKKYGEVVFGWRKESDVGDGWGGGRGGGDG